jgi:hypothetical protein
MEEHADCRKPLSSIAITERRNTTSACLQKLLCITGFHFISYCVSQSVFESQHGQHRKFNWQADLNVVEPLILLRRGPNEQGYCYPVQQSFLPHVKKGAKALPRFCVATQLVSAIRSEISKYI